MIFRQRSGSAPGAQQCTRMRLGCRRARIPANLPLWSRPGRSVTWSWPFHGCPRSVWRGQRKWRGGRCVAGDPLSLVRQLPERSTEDASGLSKSLVHLLAACLKATSDVAAPAIGRQAANVRYLAETYIENNLSSQDLDPAAMCK